MTICINCGKVSGNCICEECMQSMDVEQICRDIMAYHPGTGENTLWDGIAETMLYPGNFKNIVFAVSQQLPTPRKEYMRILCLAGDFTYVPKASRPWLYEVYEQIKEHPDLSTDEHKGLCGLVMDALYKDYFFAEAESLAGQLVGYETLPIQVYANIGEFYTKTRRYDKAEDILRKGITFYGENAGRSVTLKGLLEENEKQREKSIQGKPEYMPNPRENRQEVRQKYVDFLASVGIEAEVPVVMESKKVPTPIPRDQYPEPKEIRETNFSTFVAFDIETTGFNPKIDSMIEMGAVKVVDGQITETEAFTFREFVKPYKKSISAEVEKTTGITKEDVKDAREMWEVFPDFMKFVGDCTLVGFNCIHFDSKFMVRAGRYSNLLIENNYFDVMRYAEQFREKLELDEQKISLHTLCNKLEIINPKAHRALSDAVTTARVFLKLKEMEEGQEALSVEDLLADLDEW